MTIRANTYTNLTGKPVWIDPLAQGVRVIGAKGVQS